VKEHSGKKMTDATLYGGIRYDISPSSNLTGEETESERLALTATRSWIPMDSLSVTRGGWVYLPGTKEEAEAISTTLSSRKVQNDLLEGENGTEESFKALGGAKKDVIHIATHGFYWTETETARSGMETSSFMLDGESQAPKEDKALTRSGLLFAGAQNAFEGKDIPIDIEDGILTAKDISRMDLRGTDLVVISACQSGLGEVTGDGVFGLQRGFKKAGVQSIVMSLWEVSDEATKIMMTRFYENLAKGKSKYDAFRDAQNYLRKYDKGLFDEPEYYAAFVLLDAIK
jgi:CHAT domain-containing protein